MVADLSSRVVRDILLWHRPASFLRSLAYTAVAVVAALVMAGSSVVWDGSAFTDGHAMLSLDLALARASCGRGSSLSSTHKISQAISDDLSLRYVPLRTLVIRRAGSLEAYCRSVDTPFANNENSLMLIETAMLRLAPGASLSTLGALLQALKVAGLSVFVLLVIDLGGSLALATGVMFCSLLTLSLLSNALVYTAYPFIFVLVLLSVSAYGFAVKYRWMGRPFAGVLFVTTVGALAALVANLRTSYLPIAVSTFVCFLVAEGPSWPTRAAIWRQRRWFILATCFVVGYVGFQYGLITRFLPPQTSHNSSHSIGHPLVLALSIPANDFSREQGINWLDEVGRQKALEIDPTADYLGPRYDRALLRYYLMLWRTHPRSMLEVYRLKFSLAGPHMLASLRRTPGTEGDAVRWLLTPLALLPNGIWLLLLYGATTVAAFLSFVRRRTPQSFTLGVLSLAAVLGQLESGMVFSEFFAGYHNYLAFYAMFISLVALQGLVNGGWWLVGERVVGLFGGFALAVYPPRHRIAVGKLRQTVYRRFGRYPAELLDLRDVPPSILMRAAFVLGVIGLLFAVVPRPWQWNQPMAADDHARGSLDLAVMRSVCANDGPAYSSLVQVGSRLQSHPEESNRPLRDIAIAGAGSLERYCRDGILRITHGENTLNVIESALLRSNSQLSLVELGRRLHMLRVAMFAVVAAVLLETGFGLVFALAFFAGALELLIMLDGGTYSVYPFVPTMVTFAVALYSLWFRMPLFKAARIRYGAAALAGVLTALFVNLRSSYLPTLVLLFLIAATGSEWFWRSRASAWAFARSACQSTVCFVVGYLVLQFVVIRPLVVPGQISFHPIAHPLVLSLALPPNPLSEREGIQWDDTVGSRIVAERNPSAAYLSPEYEETLFQYYASLWWKYPSEMLHIYIAKLQMAGGGVADGTIRTAGPAQSIVAIALAPARIFRNGFWLLGVFVGIGAAAARAFIRYRSLPAVPIALLSVAAIGVHLETAAIDPYFFLPYQGYLALYLLFGSLLVYRAGFRVSWMIARLIARRPAVRHAAHSVWSAVSAAIRWLAATAFLPRPAMTLRRALAQTTIIMLLVWLAAPDWFLIERAPRPDHFTVASLDDVVSGALCGTDRSFPPTVRIAEDAAGQDSQVTAIRSLVAARTGSVDAYCAQAPGRGSQTTALSMLEQSILRARPALSFAGLAKALHALRLMLALMFVLLLMRVGYSLALTSGAAIAVLWLLFDLKPYIYSSPSFAMIVILQSVLLSVVALKYRGSSGSLSRSAVGAAIGVWSMCGVSLVPRYGPIAWALFAAFLCADWSISTRGRSGGGARQPILTAIGFAALYGALRLLVFAPAVDGGVTAVGRHAGASVGHLLLLCALGAAVLAYSAIWFARTSSSAAAVAALVAVAACATAGQSMVLGVFDPGRQSYLTFFVVFAALLVCQTAANIAFRGSLFSPVERPT